MGVVDPDLLNILQLPIDINDENDEKNITKNRFKGGELMTDLYYKVLKFIIKTVLFK
jgi:hypothetical protein